MPAAAVIPAPIAYIKVVAVKMDHSLRRALGENPTTYPATNVLTCAWAPGIGTWRLCSSKGRSTTYTGAA